MLACWAGHTPPAVAVEPGLGSAWGCGAQRIAVQPGIGPSRRWGRDRLRYFCIWLAMAEHRRKDQVLRYRTVLAVSVAFF